MKLYMKTNSPLLKEILAEQDFLDSGWSWWEGWYNHEDIISNHYGFSNFYAKESYDLVINKKKTFIEIDKKGRTSLMISAEVEATFHHKGATENVGKVTTNKCFKKDLGDTWDWFNWTSDGKTTELSLLVGKDYSSSYGDDENWIRKIEAVGEAMNLLKRFEKVKGGKDIPLNKEQKEHLEKIKVLFTSSPEQALDLADSLNLIGNLKSEMVSKAYTTIKKMGINLITIEGL